MRASEPGCSAVPMGAILRRMRSSVAASHVTQPHSADGIIDGCSAPLARQELRFISTLLPMMTSEAPQRWYASCTPCTAWQPIFEHASAIFTRRADLRRVICTPAESWRVQRPRVAVRGAGEAALDNSRRYTPKDEVHAKGPTAIRQGALENGDRTRALSRRGRTHRVHDG